MDVFENCKTLNDIARQVFGKANYYNRERCKKILGNNGIDWKEWINDKKNKNSEKFCVVCGKKLTKNQNKFCSHSCSAKYSNSHRSLSNQTKRKISESVQKQSINFNGILKPYILKEKKSFCEFCGKELSQKQYRFCSNKCSISKRNEEYIERWKNGLEDGLKGAYGVSSHIRNYLFSKYNCQCELCGWGIKNEFTNKIPLEIHHKDGNYKNNSEENLQLLCPNCHSLTNTYKSHNKTGRKKRNKYN